MRNPIVPIQTTKKFLASLLAAGLTLAAFAAVKTGDIFPNLESFSLEGKLPVSKGKIVIVDFWASWCGPCKESFPVLNDIQKKYADKGVVVVAVNVDENKGDMDDFLKEHSADFAIVRDAKQKLVSQVKVATMPTSFILDASGKVRFVHNGFHGSETGKQYEKEIQSLLNQP